MSIKDNVRNFEKVEVVFHGQEIKFAAEVLLYSRKIFFPNYDEIAVV